MAVELSKKDIENITKYKYETNPWTPLDYVYNPFWEAVTNALPRVSLVLFLLLISFTIII